MMKTVPKKIWLSLACVGLFHISVLSADQAAVKAARVAKVEIAETKAVIPVARAVAAINPTKGNHVTGLVQFTLVDDGVRIVADVEGLTPGKHGFHVHEFGDCSAPDAASAGGHFNPTKKKHGGPEYLERHVGDLGNIVADQNGHGKYDRVDRIIKLEGPESIIGKSIIIHALADDYTTQPSGNAGGRVACGIIMEK